MYDEILALIDGDLDRLQRARSVLTGRAAEASIPALKTRSKIPARTKQLALTTTLTPVAATVAAPALPKRPRQPRKPRLAAQPIQPLARFALQSEFPTAPVAVSAAEVRKLIEARAAQPEAQVTLPLDGTLDTLVEELQGRVPF